MFWINLEGMSGKTAAGGVRQMEAVPSGGSGQPADGRFFRDLVDRKFDGLAESPFMNKHPGLPSLSGVNAGAVADASGQTLLDDKSFGGSSGDQALLEALQMLAVGELLLVAADQVPMEEPAVENGVAGGDVADQDQATVADEPPARSGEMAAAGSGRTMAGNFMPAVRPEMPAGQAGAHASGAVGDTDGATKSGFEHAADMPRNAPDETSPDTGAQIASDPAVSGASRSVTTTAPALQHDTPETTSGASSPPADAVFRAPIDGGLPDALADKEKLARPQQADTGDVATVPDNSPPAPATRPADAMPDAWAQTPPEAAGTGAATRMPDANDLVPGFVAGSDVAVPQSPGASADVVTMRAPAPEAADSFQLPPDDQPATPVVRHDVLAGEQVAPVSEAPAGVRADVILPAAEQPEQAQSEAAMEQAVSSEMPVAPQPAVIKDKPLKMPADESFPDSAGRDASVRAPAVVESPVPQPLTQNAPLPAQEYVPVQTLADGRQDGKMVMPDSDMHAVRTPVIEGHQPAPEPAGVEMPPPEAVSGIDFATEPVRGRSTANENGPDVALGERPASAEGASSESAPAEAAAAAPHDVAERVERLQEMLAGLDRHILRAAAQEDRALVIRLVPANLGRVQLSCHAEDNRIRVEMLVENGGVRTLIQQQESALRDILQQSGYRLDQFDVRTQHEGDHARSFRDRPASGRRGRIEADGVAVADKTAPDTPAGAGYRHHHGKQGVWFVA